jgi:hypothetical protein
LEVYLGRGKKLDKGNYGFYCPFCQHKNPKLVVNVTSGDYNCFTCHPPTKGKTPVTLLKKVGAPTEAIIEMKGYFKNDTTKIDVEKETKAIIIPKEFLSLADKSDKSLDMGYCKTGRYGNKVVVPSYDSKGRLNYFVARSFEKDPKQKIDSPSCSKSETIGFEYYVNWNVPVILCEGVFDAISIKRNAIPLFGKTIPKALMIKLLQPQVKTIYLALDDDAIMESIDHAQKLLDFGKEVYLIQLNGKDPSEIGFEGMIQYLHNAKPMTSSSLLMLKMQTSLC